MNWYVLFVKTGQEQLVAQQLKKRLDPELFKPFVILKEQKFRKSGLEIMKRGICFPGYIFIESALASSELFNNIRAIIKENSKIHRILNYGNWEYISVFENERTLLQTLCDSQYCIQYSIGILEDNRAQISSGGLVGMENLIKTINRHKKEAVVEIEFIGVKKQMHLGLEIVEKK